MELKKASKKEACDRQNTIDLIIWNPIFGKSLFLSTLKAYFEGKRELFEGLKIAELEKDDPHAFEPYPVFYIDFNRANYMAESALESAVLRIRNCACVFVMR